VEQNKGSVGRRSPTGAVFDLERFGWAAPDRLDVAGRFEGLSDAPRDAPVLIVRAGDSTHRLPVVPDSLSGQPENGQPWHATFAWQSAPVPFDMAELEIGEDIVVTLPEPAGAGASSDGHAGDDPASTAAGGLLEGSERLRLEAQLLAMGEEIRSLESTLEQSRDELARARQALDDERERRSADAARFREGLAQVQASAESVLGEERAAVDQLHAAYRELVESTAAKDESLKELRAALAEQGEERARSESQLRAEVARLTERVTELEPAESRLGELQAEADEARSALATVTEAAETARADTEKLLARLTTLRDVTTAEAGR
jgi:hypothetical protein